MIEMAPRLPAGASLRIVGDVHGDSAAFSYAAATDHFVVQLGDLVDHGPDSAGVLRIMFDLIDRGRGLFILGNHDLKLARALSGHSVRIDSTLRATINALDDGLRSRLLQEAARAPAWLFRDQLVLVHGGFHSRMLEQPAPVHGINRADGLLARALFGEPTGRIQPDGFPERSLRWIDHIPDGWTVYCGHDQRSTDGRPLRKRGALGGAAVFLDTGAGKGGHLSWIDVAR